MRTRWLNPILQLVLIGGLTLCAAAARGSNQQEPCQIVQETMAGITRIRASEAETDANLTGLLLEGNTIDVSTNDFIHLNAGQRGDRGMWNQGVFQVERDGQLVVLKFAVQGDSVNPYDVSGLSARGKLPAVLTHENVRDGLLIHQLLGELGVAPRLKGIVPPAELVAIANRINERARKERRDPPIDIDKLNAGTIGVVMEPMPGAWNLARDPGTKQSFLKDVSTADIQAVVTKLQRISSIFNQTGIDPRDLQIFITTSGKGKIDVSVADLDAMRFGRGANAPKPPIGELNLDLLEHSINVAVHWELQGPKGTDGLLERKFPFDKLPVRVSPENLAKLRKLLSAAELDLGEYTRVMDAIKTDAKTAYSVQLNMHLTESELGTAVREIATLQLALKVGDRRKTWDEMTSGEKNTYRKQMIYLSIGIAQAKDALGRAEAWLKDHTTAPVPERTAVSKRIETLKDAVGKAEKQLPWIDYIDRVNREHSIISALAERSAELLTKDPSSSRGRRAKELLADMISARNSFTAVVSDPEKMLKSAGLPKEEKELLRQTAVPLMRSRILEIQMKLQETQRNLIRLGEAID